MEEWINLYVFHKKRSNKYIVKTVPNIWLQEHIREATVARKMCDFNIAINQFVWIQVNREYNLQGPKVLVDRQNLINEADKRETLEASPDFSKRPFWHPNLMEPDQNILIKQETTFLLSHDARPI